MSINVYKEFANARHFRYKRLKYFSAIPNCDFRASFFNMNGIPRRSNLTDILESGIWCCHDSKEFMRMLFVVCFEYILYQRTNADRRNFDVYDFYGFHYKSFKEDIRCEFLKTIRSWMPKLLEEYDKDSVHTLYLLLNDKANATNIVEVHSFKFYRARAVTESIESLAKETLVNIVKSVLMSIANLRSLTAVIDTDKVGVSFSLAYEEEGKTSIHLLHPALGHYYQSNIDNFVCKSVDVGNFWTGFHEIQIYVKYDLVNFVKVMFGVMERVREVQRPEYPNLPESPTSSVDDAEQNFPDLIPLSNTSREWSKCFLNQLIRSSIGTILHQRTNVDTADFDRMVFKNIDYTVIKEEPMNLISMKINSLLPFIYSPILRDQIYSFKFVFCKASKPPESLEVYQFIIKKLEDKGNDESQENREVTLEQQLCNFFKAINTITSYPISLYEFITYFRLHFVETVPLPRYQLPYYEINAYHDDDDDVNNIVYNTKTLGSVKTRFHEITLVVHDDFLSVNDYLHQVLREKYDSSDLDHSSSSEEEESSNSENEVTIKRRKIDSAAKNSAMDVGDDVFQGGQSTSGCRPKWEKETKNTPNIIVENGEDSTVAPKGVN